MPNFGVVNNSNNCDMSICVSWRRYYLLLGRICHFEDERIGTMMYSRHIQMRNLAWVQKSRDQGCGVNIGGCWIGTRKQIFLNPAAFFPKVANTHNSFTGR